MSHVPISKLPLVDEYAVTGEVAESFDAMRSMLGVPTVGVGHRISANSLAVAVSSWGLFGNFMQRTTLPPSLLFMIHYTISSARKCQWCSGSFRHACRSVGIDEEMLEALVHDLDAVAPRRTQEIIKFAVRCAMDPQGLTEADYDRVREQGLSDEEIVELIGWAALAMYFDTLADAMKLIDPEKQQVLED